MVTVHFQDGITADLENLKAAAIYSMRHLESQGNDDDPAVEKITDKETGKVLWIDDNDDAIIDLLLKAEFSNKELKRFAKKLQDNDKD